MKTFAVTSSFAVALLHSVLAFAQLPVARLSSVFPPGGQRGTAVDVTVAGTDLDALTALRFSTPLISAQPKLDAAGKPVANAFTVRIAADLRPGAYDVCAIGRFGASNPRAFVVDADPQAVASTANTAPEAAIDLPLDTGVYAVATLQASQFFRIKLKAGQRVWLDVDGQVIDTKFDPVIVLYDVTAAAVGGAAAGGMREVARQRDGKALDFTAPADGTFLVEVVDALYAGGPEYAYRLRVSTRPRVEFVSPQAVNPHVPTDLSLFGHGLPGATPIAPGATLQRLAVKPFEFQDGDDAAGLSARWFVPPAMAMLDGTMRYAFAGGINPTFLARSPRPLVAEQAENDEPAKAQTMTPPVDVYGQFYPRGDRDWFSFDAKKGEAFWVEVVSNRLTGITDPMVLIQRVTKDAKGAETLTDVKEAYDPENIANPPREFFATHRDPAFRFQTPEDGTYRVLVRDLFNEAGDDVRRTYRLSIAPAASREDFRLVAWAQSPQPAPPAPGTTTPPPTQVWGANLRPGGVMPMGVLAFRSGGFAGDITLTATGLPPGVTCPPVTLSAGTNIATLLLAADEKAAAWAGPVCITATAKASGGASLSHVARAGTVVFAAAQPDIDPPRSRLAQELIVAVTSGEVDPITVRPAEQKVWENSVAGVIEIPLKLTRRLGFTGAAKLKPLGGVAALSAMPAIDVPANAIDGKLTIDAGALALGVGNYSVYLQATSAAPYDRDPAARAAAQATKDAADKATPELAVALQKAKDALAAAKTANKPEQIKAAEAAVADAEAKAKQNDAAKAAADAQVKAMAPKEVTAVGYSTPIDLKITASPITLAPPAPIAAAKPGAKVEVAVAVTRLYGFADPIDLTLVAPKGVAGFTAAAVNVPKDKSQATVSLQLAPDVKPGDYTLTLTASFKQNNRPLKIEQPLAIKVVPS
jgi:hypothetical protein